MPFFLPALAGLAAGALLSKKKSSSSQPTSQTITQTNIPDYARPYVEDMLGRAQALTTQNSYQPYTGQRVADPTALQTQSYNAARGIGGPMVGNSGLVANDVARDAMTMTKYDPRTFNYQSVGTPMWSKAAADQYMSPYIQGVLDINKREATRQNDMAALGDSAAAVGAGSFGGSRSALVEAERNRNHAMLLNDIQTQGMNDAWMQAQGMFTSDQARNLQGQMANQDAGLTAQQLSEQSRQFGAGLGLQGLQTKLAAGQLGLDSGNAWMNQKLGITALQNQLGTQQQAQQQMKLDAAYQDYENSRLWPYKQLEFMNSIVRGNYAPGQTTSMYQQPPSFASQMIGGVTAAAGAKQAGLFKKGGKVKRKMAYAEGGITDVEARPVSGIAELLISQIN